MEKVFSHSDFLAKRSESGKTFLLLYKPGSEQSNCAYQNISNAFDDQLETRILTADVTTVKDIHEKYGITSVPSFLVFVNSKLTNIIKGCHESNYYKALTENVVFQIKKSQEAKIAKRVTVYSTPSCSWCNTLKMWLQKNNITYTDVDVSRDQNAAESLVRRTGQQGVPQTDINGQIVVGFNQPRLQELLEIK